MRVLHRCDNPPCVRPEHLFLGTQADNVLDMMAKGRHRAAKQEFKLSDDRREWIVNVYANGLLTQSDLAWLFDVSQTGVSSIIRRQGCWERRQCKFAEVAA